MKRDRSTALFQAAQQVIPGGVNSPVRAFRAVGGEPFFVERAEGATVIDADGNRYIDYIGSWGVLIHGHAHPRVAAAITEAIQGGWTYGAPTALETTLAAMVVEALPSVELIRFVSSGTEAVMSALRLARAVTGRDTIVNFSGCYHGHVDSLLVQAGSGSATLGVPDSAGVPAAFVAHTLSLPFNDLEAVKEVMGRRGREVAAIIVEPVAGNMGVVPPRPGFLEGLREITEHHGALLIFDEVITGFRVGYGGAQGRTGIIPDLTCLGKVLGGGLPIGAYGGGRGLMEQVAPLGPVYQAGTLSGNPLAMVAGIETLKLLRDGQAYELLECAGEAIEAGIREALAQTGVPGVVNRVGSMWTCFFTNGPVEDYASAKQSDVKTYGAFFRALLAEGVSLPPSQFEAAFCSTAHSPEAIERTVAAIARTLAQVTRG